ncbi:alpha/beta hydrolase [Kineosporia sp. J2-2]|uniref:Alpha/beta hydrolase n=1 Tax=Kineosporia corallincola TaxID=2835133 RepID=A0ABS5TG07_9ACTN|nr:alpha/beta hydrolase [Kineosporia corallincola]MBT0770028.1 alpha/beta hydrolase [Kineosporia corallincola]
MKLRHHSALLRRTGIGLGALTALAGVAGAVFVHRMNSYEDPWKERVSAADYVLRTAPVNGVELSYAEGPDNGPPLVLLHAQHMDWFSYSRVLPALAQRFHVYDIDYPGHGATVTPTGYPMTATRIGTDLADFIETRIGEPAYVTGNSSGGLLATWLAANRPRTVRAVLLEDPPLFSSEAGRIGGTIADRSFATSADAVRDGTDDFLLYWIDHSGKFFDNNVFRGAGDLLTQGVRLFRWGNPGEPVELGFLKNDTVRLLVRGLDEYDPRFGTAFHDGTWNQGFDHATALADIDCPVLLLQADYTVLPDGTLNGAMTRPDAERAASLLKHGTYRRIDATHVVHLDRPEQFTRILEDFFLG